MHITGHQLKGDVLDSLLSQQVDSLNSQKSPAKLSEATTTIFGTRTDDPFKHLDDERTHYVLSELKFAADNAQLDLSKEQIESFIKSAESDKLKGKSLEKAARKFCNEISRDFKEPIGTTKLSNSEFLNSRQVTSSTCNIEDGINDNKTGGYLGMKSNPNTIMNPNALQKAAQTQSLDELRKDEKQYEQDFKKAQKDKATEQYNKESEGVIRNKIITAGSSESTPTHQPAQSNNIMSIFSSDRDFAGIPERTAGESIAASSKARSEKASNEYVGAEIKPVVKTASSLVDQVGKVAEKETTPNKEDKQYIIKKSSNESFYTKVATAATKNNNTVSLKDGFSYSATISENEIILDRINAA